MEYLSQSLSSSASKQVILCCECGIQIKPNATNMCVGCVRTRVDITDGIPKQCVIYFCKKCERYLQQPATWVLAELESRELLTVCLKKLKGLNRVNLIDAGFIWTEPHSKRIKVKLTVQKEIFNGAVLQQVFVVEFTVHSQMCSDCHKSEAKDFWRALVQVRQKVLHKKTFYFMEQIILKHNAHRDTVNIKPIHGGLDFYFAQKQEARKLLEFLLIVAPCRYQSAQELISHDVKSNIYNYKLTYSVEISPVCKDSVVCLPAKVAQSLGSINPICVVYRVTQFIHLIDPNSLQIAEVSGSSFWHSPFETLCTSKQLSEYMVMDVEIISKKDYPNKIPMSHKHILANVWLARMVDLGVNDCQYHCRTHIGHLLNPGDIVLGFDMANSNINNRDFDKLKKEKIADVVVIKKKYDRRKRTKNRKWKLKHIQGITTDRDNAGEDYVEFLEDLEEDPAFRSHVNIYVDKQKTAVDLYDAESQEIPQISLQEMMEDLTLEDPTGGGDADMV